MNFPAAAGVALLARPLFTAQGSSCEAENESRRLAIRRGRPRGRDLKCYGTKLKKSQINFRTGLSRFGRSRRRPPSLPGRRQISLDEIGELFVDVDAIFLPH